MSYSSDEDRPPPDPLVSIEAEAALLGACLLDNRIIGNVGHIVSQKDFYEPLHGRIWRVLSKFYEVGKLAAPATLRPAFEADPAMQQVGGVAYLAQLTGSGAALIGASDFAKQIRDLARLREVKESVGKGLEAIGTDGTLEDFLVEVEKAVAHASTTIRNIELLDTADMVDLATKRAETSIESGIPGASCKLIPDLDTLLGKLEPGQMTILAGRPGMGKSTTALSGALGYAMDGNPVLYALAESSNEMFSLKMTADLLHAAGNPVPFKDLRQGLLDKGQMRALAKAKEVAKRLPIKFAHIGRSDVKRLEAIAAREAARLMRDGRKLAVVVVDYLQLLDAAGRYKSGDERGRVNAVSEALLMIAQRLQCHVIALSQLSRAVEARDDKRPRLSDLRESGRLEEDADNVLMVYREEYYLEKAKPTAEKDLEAWETDMGFARGKVELIAAKTRFGSNATRKANFLGDYSAVRGSNYHGVGYVADEMPDLFHEFYTGGEE